MLQTANDVRFDKCKSEHIYHDQDVFEANEVTIRVLEICRQPQSEVEIVGILFNEYQVNEADLVKDISSITAELLEAGLLVKVQ